MIAGLNRKRKNAASGEGLENYPKSNGKVGRPSKGGDLIRSKRYYFKNHLKVLQKRKLKRYVTTVKKLVSKHMYQSEIIMEELQKLCTLYKLRDNKSIGQNTIIRAVNLGREDRYLSFMEEEADKVLSSVSFQTLDSDEIQQTLMDLASKHATRLFQITTLWSAYLISHFVQKEFAMDPEEGKLEKMGLLVEAKYIIDYSHLNGQELPEGFIQGERFEDGGDDIIKKKYKPSLDSLVPLPSRLTPVASQEKAELRTVS